MYSLETVMLTLFFVFFVDLVVLAFVLSSFSSPLKIVSIEVVTKLILFLSFASFLMGVG